MSSPPAWFADAMCDAIRKDRAVLFMRSLSPEDRRLFIWALRTTRREVVSPEEREKCRRLLEQQAQLDG